MDTHHSYKIFFKGTTPIQRRSVICYLDCLGFKDLIDKDRTGGLLNRFFSVYIKSVREIRSSSTASEMFSVKTFSDNFILACPIDTEDTETEFGLVLTLVNAFQREMSLNSYFFRGVIEVGDVHISDDLVYGQGLVDAYQLESKKAKFPRIIIGPNLRNHLKEWNKNYAPLANPSSKAILAFEDGEWFVNYLFNLYLSDEPARLDDIRNHRNQIESLLRKELSSDVREKYLWVARYHNYFCQINGFSDLVCNGKLNLFSTPRF